MDGKCVAVTLQAGKHRVAIMMRATRTTNTLINWHKRELMRAKRTKKEGNEYADMDEFEDDKLIQEGDCDLKPEDSFLWSEYPDDEILRTRTYDLAIQFRDNIPHIWLFGWDENRQALSQAQIREDILLRINVKSRAK
jgi:hypothetical protein